MRTSNLRASRFPPLAAQPAMAWFALFLAAPLAIVLVISLATKGTYGGIVYRFTLDNYARAFDPLYLKVLWSSIALAGVTAASCLAIGYPLAYVLATAPPRLRGPLLMAVMIPFWTNFVVRAYAIKILLAETGPLNALLAALGLIHSPIPFASSPLAVWIGMVANYLPFMVLPLLVAIGKLDFALLEAARDLGASRAQTAVRVLLPLTRRGIVTGLVFVFTPALGEFVIPDLLGGARVMLIGNLVTDQFLKARDWPFGSALSLLMILAVLATLAIYARYGADRPAQERPA